MKKIIARVAFTSICLLYLSVVHAENLKPQITVLHSSTKSNAGEAFSYPTGTPRMTIAQVIFPVGAKLPMHTHPAPLIVHIMSGELTSERPDGDVVVYKAGDTFIEAPNSPHKVTNTAKRPTIVYGVFAGAEGLGPLTVFMK